MPFLFLLVVVVGGDLTLFISQRKPLQVNVISISGMLTALPTAGSPAPCKDRGCCSPSPCSQWEPLSQLSMSHPLGCTQATRVTPRLETELGRGWRGDVANLDAVFRFLRDGCAAVLNESIFYVTGFPRKPGASEQQTAAQKSARQGTVRPRIHTSDQLEHFFF